MVFVLIIWLYCVSKCLWVYSIWSSLSVLHIQIYNLHQIWKICSLYLFKYYFVPFFSHCSISDFIMNMVACLKMFHRSLMPCSLFYFFFLFLILSNFNCPVSTFTDISFGTCSNLFLGPSYEFFILVIVHINSRMSIWFLHLISLYWHVHLVYILFSWFPLVLFCFPFSLWAYFKQFT